MPRAFSPGHRPDSPLYPDETVYTTPTKVSEYLQLPLPDPVALAGDSVIASNDIKFPITGADYRRWGYEVGDAIVVYDNANAIGNTYTLTSIASVGASGQVYLIATKAASESFTTANKGYVQHQSAFTNSNERGIKLSHVKNLIRQRQDYIDKVCRHAWRPRLVGEEYLNFTTFKPFRRRYYTDYVGAVFHRDALGLAMIGDINIETQRRASYIGTDVVASAMYGVGTIYEGYGASIYSDSTVL